MRPEYLSQDAPLLTRCELSWCVGRSRSRSSSSCRIPSYSLSTPLIGIEVKDVRRSRLQLVVVAAMRLISKIEEVYAPAVSDFVYITDHAEIRHMELKIIRALDIDLRVCQHIFLNFLRLVVNVVFYMKHCIQYFQALLQGWGC